MQRPRLKLVTGKQAADPRESMIRAEFVELRRQLDNLEQLIRGWLDPPPRAA